MESAFYVTLSAQTALQRRLETIATNVAHSNTPGYRSEGVRFASLLARRGGIETAFATPGDAFITRHAGAVAKTGSPLDFAIQGEGWFAVQAPGGTAYTRDGRFTMAEDGLLRASGGHPVLDIGGAPLVVDPQAGPLAVARDGMITQGGRQVGAIGLFAIDRDARLARGPDGSVRPDRPAAPQLDFAAAGIVQGAVEGSNVDPVMEMARLIAVTRTFEQIASAQQATEAVYSDAIRALATSG